MNKIYSKIWNKSLGQLVVASELASSDQSAATGACRSGSKLGRPAALAAAVLLGLLTANPALAGTCVQGDAIGTNTANGTGSTAPATCDALSIAIGGGSGATATGTSIAIGDTSVAVGLNSIALGTAANVTGNEAIAIGDSTVVDHDDAVAIGLGSQAHGKASFAAGSGAVAGDADDTAIGSRANTTTGGGNTAVGTGAHAGGTGDDTALGNNASATGGVSVSLGNNANALGNGGVAIGSNAIVNFAHDVALGSGSEDVRGAQTNYAAYGLAAPQTSTGEVNVGNRQITGVAAGSGANDAVNVSQLSALAGTLTADAIHYFSVNDGGKAGANFNNDGAIGSGSIAIGDGAAASKAASVGIAIGNGAVASADHSMAIGALSSAAGDHSFAAGSGSIAGDSQGTAIGYDAFTTTGVGNTAVGSLANAGGSTGNDTALGTASDASGGQSVAVGSSAVASGAASAAVGSGAQASATNALAIGKGAQANGANAIAIGTGNIVSGANSGAFGDPNSVTGSGSYAVGNDNTVANNNAFVIGNNVTTSQDNSVVLGNASTDRAATTVTGVTLNGSKYGYAGAGSAANGVVSVGGVGSERQIINVAAGDVSTSSTDAVNGSQLFATNTALVAVGTTVTTLGNSVATGLGGGSSYDPTTGTLTTALNYNGNKYGSVQSVFDQITASAAGGFKYFHTNSTLADSQAIGTDSVAIGPSATATGNTSVAEGAGSNAWNTNSIAIGHGATAGISSDATRVATVAIGNNAAATAQNSVAIGDSASASGPQATAIGSSSIASSAQATALGRNANAANNATAIGMNSTATGTRSTAVGQGTSVAVNDGTAVGQMANVTAVGGVALGLGSSASRTGLAGGTELFSNASVASTSGAVSVGTAGGERQITNVAGGTQATDAVNVRQLQSVQGQMVNTIGSSYMTANPDGSVTGPTFNLNNVDKAGGQNAQAYTNVGDALGGLSDSISNVDNLVGGIISGGGIKYFHANSALADSQANGSNSVSIGGGSVAGGAQSISIGTGNNVSGDNSGAFGDPNIVSGAGSYAVGNNNTIANDNTFVIGSGVTTTQDNSVVLGNASADRAATTVTGDTINGTAYTYAGQGSAANGVVSVGGVGSERQIINVAAGEVSANSTDAVNGSQLFATNSAVTALGSAIGGITSGAGIKYFHANSTDPDSGASGLNSIAIGPNAVASTDNSVALGDGAVTAAAVASTGAVIGGTAYSFAGGAPVGVVSVGAVGAERQIQNVAAGRVSNSSTDAVNGSQLYATNQQVTKNTNDITTLQNTVNGINSGGGGMFQSSVDSKGSPTATGTNSAAGGANATASGSNSTAVGNGSTASGNGSTAVGNGAQATGNNSVAIGTGSVADRDNSVSVGSAGNDRQVTNVAAGTAGTDAVNVNQLQASQAGGVHYDSNADGSSNYGSVTMDPGGDPTVIHNVGAGTAVTDAANVGQVNEGITTAENWSKSYTDQKFSAIDKNLNTISNRANGGVASAMAMASLPQAYQPNQSSASVAFGNYHGQTGIAVGMSKISESGHYVFKLNATANTRGDAGVGVGAGVVW